MHTQTHTVTFTASSHQNHQDVWKIHCLCFVLMAEHGLCVNHALSDCEKLNCSMIKAYQFLNKLLQLFQKTKTQFNYDDDDEDDDNEDDHGDDGDDDGGKGMNQIQHKYFNRSQSGWKCRLELHKPRLISAYLAHVFYGQSLTKDAQTVYSIGPDHICNARMLFIMER